MNVYFISGMCVNCKVFDKIQLPDNYTKKYLEWVIPKGNETIEEYARLMADDIDESKPFVIVGYSLGGIIMQEMNKFLSPEKNILISSIKDKKEIPYLFRVAKVSQIPQYLPRVFYSVNDTLSNLFSRLVYNMSKEEVEEYVSYTSSAYMKWATCQITNWKPLYKCNNLYHIHGTNDQVFPCRLVTDAHILEDADHLMVLRKSDEVNRIISEILLKK